MGRVGAKDEEMGEVGEKSGIAKAVGSQSTVPLRMRAHSETAEI